MNQKVATARALSTYIARQSLILINRVVFGVLIGLALLVVALAIFISQWWLLLLIVVAMVYIVVLIASSVARAVIRSIYRHPFSSTQREALEDFTQKLQRLVDAQGMSQLYLAFLTIWDIIRYREPRHFMRIIDDSLSLKTDYQNLEKYFGEA